MATAKIGDLTCVRGAKYAPAAHPILINMFAETKDFVAMRVNRLTLLEQGPNTQKYLRFDI